MLRLYGYCWLIEAMVMSNVRKSRKSCVMIKRFMLLNTLFNLIVVYVLQGKL